MLRIVKLTLAAYLTVVRFFYCTYLLHLLLSRWLQKLPSLKLEFLLPLPLLVIAFGLSGELLTNQLLSRSYSTLDKLQADTHTVKIQMAVNLIVTEIETVQEQDFTLVEINTANSVLKKLKFQLPVTELSKGKALIAQEIGLNEQVKALQPNTQMQAQFVVNVIGILAEINQGKGLTKIEVKTANHLLKSLEFELPVTELNKVKDMINQNLGLSREDARLLVSYRVKF